MRHSAQGHLRTVPYDDDGNPVTGAQPITGAALRYESLSHVDLEASSGDFVNVYSVSEKSVLYSVAMVVDSDAIHMRIEVDSQEILPSILLSDLKDLGLSEQGASSGAHRFGLFHHDPSKWMWIPPDPILVVTSLKIQMRSSTQHTNKDFEAGLAVRRTLV